MRKDIKMSSYFSKKDMQLDYVIAKMHKSNTETCKEETNDEEMSIREAKAFFIKGEYVNSEPPTDIIPCSKKMKTFLESNMEWNNDLQMVYEHILKTYS